MYEVANSISAAEAAQVLGVSQRTLYNFIDRNEIGSHRDGRVIRLAQSDIDAYLNRARVRPGSLPRGTDTFRPRSTTPPP